MWGSGRYTLGIEEMYMGGLIHPGVVNQDDIPGEV